MSVDALLFAAILAAPMPAIAPGRAGVDATDAPRFQLAAAMSPAQRHTGRFVVEAKATHAPPTLKDGHLRVHAHVVPNRHRSTMQAPSL